MTKPKVPLRGAGCRKLRCDTGSEILHRHHIRHQAMWIGVWRSRRRGEKKFEDFCKRYRAFMAEDVEYICDKHHAEIHEVYDKIIAEDKKRTGLPLSKYSWVQANKLMDKLERAFSRWLSTQTPGIFPRQLDARRRVRKLLAKNKQGIKPNILQSEK